MGNPITGLPREVLDTSRVTDTSAATDTSAVLHKRGGPVLALAPEVLAATPAVAQSLLPSLKITSTAEERSFGAGTRDNSGRIRLSVRAENPPASPVYVWTYEAGVVDIAYVDGDALQPEISALKPGLHTLTLNMRDSNGNLLAQARVNISAPQFVVADGSPELEDVLPRALRGDILRKAREVANLLLAPANVRTIWRLAPLYDQVPKQFESTPGNLYLTTALIENEFEILSRGETINPPGFNEAPYGPSIYAGAIRIFPGNYTKGSVATAPINALLNARQDQIDAGTNDYLIDQLLVETYGRLLGGTLAHEVFHSVVGHQPDVEGIGYDGHHWPPEPSDILNDSRVYDFTQLTGIRVIDPQAFPEDSTSYELGPIRAITSLSGNVGTKTRKLVQAFVPVPPRFK